MNQAKIFIAFAFLLAFAVCVSAQEQMPKIVWKNIQEKYESFYDIKPIIKNLSNQDIYFDCSDSDYGSFPNYSYDEKFKLLFNNVDNHWDWNVMGCGFKTKKELKEIDKQNRKIEKLKKEYRYIPSGCKLEPNREYTIRISEKMWKYIIFGEGSAIYNYGSGKYKFTLEYEWANAHNPIISESPEFIVKLEEETE